MALHPSVDVWQWVGTGLYLAVLAVAQLRKRRLWTRIHKRRTLKKTEAGGYPPLTAVQFSTNLLRLSIMLACQWHDSEGRTVMA